MLIKPEYIEYVKIVVSILAIVNPLGAIPVFVNLTAGSAREERKSIARISALSVALILIISVWGGEALLDFFGISIPSFRVAGGLLILLMAISMMHARLSDTQHTANEAEEAERKDNIAVVPLAIPLMAGPGAMSLVITLAHQAPHWADKLVLSAGVFIVALAVWVALYLAEPLSRVLGTTGINIGTRVMGLILTAVGIEFIAAGLKQLFPVLS